MFHSVTNNAVTSPSQISEYDFRRLMSRLHDDGFQAITTLQLADFMEKNARIPPRSVLLIVDDRKSSDYFNILFRQYWEDWGWPVVNAWISTDQSSADLWQQQVDLENEGWVDHQAHGFIHNIPIGPDSTEEYILGELQKPIDVFQENFHKIPIAVIWPGGGFTPHAAEVARELGYRLGFTINPRGPVMFNWVPLADWPDPRRPTWIPEGPVNDPLMVLPRYWDTDAIVHIIEVMQVGQEAATYAAQNKATELEYYDIACAAQYGPIP
ncbi:MAG: polysaccharide deacetylase family protein [Chloroflexi bacterium]|nr:polysaccharide deacetylase family protein [Chloroflexota bacterium]